MPKEVSREMNFKTEDQMKSHWQSKLNIVASN